LTLLVIKWPVAKRLRPAKIYYVGWICPRRGATGGFFNFLILLQLLINVNRNATVQRKGMEIAMF
jgi:hypothetical protein